VIEMKIKTMTSMRLRASRFLSERYRLRERTGYLADLVLWAVVLVTAVVLPWYPLVQAMETLK
jgi:hypothetical protein